LTAICDSGILPQILDSNPDPDEFLIGSLCRISESCLSQLPSRISDDFCFLPDLLHFCDQPAVYYMFEALAGNAGLNDYFRAGFVKQVTDTIIQYFPINAEKVKYLYRLLTYMIGLSDLTDLFLSPGFVQFALGHLEGTDDTVQAMQWKALAAMVCHESCGALAPAIPTAIGAISCDPSGGILENHVEALNFVSRMFATDPKMAGTIDAPSLFDLVCKLFQEFPDHSIWMHSISVFLITCLADSQTRHLVLTTFIANSFYSREGFQSVVQRAFVTDVCRKIRKLRAADPGFAYDLERYRGFWDFCQSRVEPLEQILQREYGKVMRIPEMPLDIRSSDADFGACSLEI
jgi:hypothetical protein